MQRPRAPDASRQSPEAHPGPESRLRTRRHPLSPPRPLGPSPRRPPRARSSKRNSGQTREVAYTFRQGPQGRLRLRAWSASLAGVRPADATHPPTAGQRPRPPPTRSAPARAGNGLQLPESRARSRSLPAGPAPTQSAAAEAAGLGVQSRRPPPHLALPLGIHPLPDRAHPPTEGRKPQLPPTGSAPAREGAELQLPEGCAQALGASAPALRNGRSRVRVLTPQVRSLGRPVALLCPPWWDDASALVC
ncbi:proline-rich protein HaeIII subfamily 1-like [Choloepus didactylus]|uniref:proline-rich protein HaeIII subfamily 1-like n=1 Tax=Choloepus didactylus TaxID=27675 RepID=UPI00189DA8F4|nr:proline-rich protein HaeIII subfamily 1-like [Choloepus didactylus]